MNPTQLIIVFFGLASPLANSKSIRDEITLCKATDPNLSECVREAANKLIPNFKTDLDGFGVMDPLNVDSIEFEENTEYVKLSMKYKDLVQTGLSDMVVEKADIDLDKGTMKFETFLPLFIVVGNYKSNGTILNMDTNGEGRFNSTHLDTKSKTLLEVSREKRGDLEYFKLDNFKINYDFGKAFLEYKGIFGGDLELEKMTNEFLNEHSEEIMNDLKPTTEKIYMDLYAGYIQKFFDKFPIKDLFLPD